MATNSPLCQSRAIACFLAALLISTVSSAQEFDWATDLPVGSELTPISAPDQNGVTRSLPDLVGGNGLVLVMSRSYAWCPFCIRQFDQLIEVEDQLNALGFNVATMTYDPVAVLTEFAADHDADFPLLSDAPNYENVKAMGILNAQYAPGERPYGIPYPGIFILDENGIIRAKFAEEDYKVRPSFSLVLEAIESF